MKKTILTAMLFFAFLVVGVQNATAQFVTNDQATIILAAETQSAINDPGYSNATNKDATWQYLNSKIVFYTTVKDQIAAGSSVETAILVLGLQQKQERQLVLLLFTKKSLVY
jgi:hypothetical protein